MSFPRTTVGGLSLPRMLIGTNHLLGWGHKTASLDKSIVARNKNREVISSIIRTYMEYGIDAVMAPIGGTPEMTDGIKDAEDKTGKRVIRIDTPIVNMDDSAAGRAEAQKVIDRCKAAGSDFCLIHHSSAEQLVNKNTQTIDRLPDYTKMIRDAGMIPGLSAHMPELIVYSDANGYDVETYIQIYNCMGFLMQVEIEYIHKVIISAKKPVMTIKPMAAGRVTPFVGLTFNYATLRECDMVTVGASSGDEVREDVEIALAAIERRPPDTEGRNSPNKSSIML
ncbi:MAG: hypothetical protein FWH16_04305 [Oscillospiraceae bacterium]|nr:hypothetical protein [Oscillospiraceae bacterium]